MVAAGREREGHTDPASFSELLLLFVLNFANFTRSSSLSNNPKILNNYLIFTAPADATVDEHFCAYSLLPTTIGAVQYVKRYITTTAERV